tara:strand:+ start:1129 stop:1365 length:237 start_codon:yes stop_codon:yes gene_type:complete
MTKKKTTFLGLQIPDNISKAISKDAEKHFRGKGQHIIWILDQYILERNRVILSKGKDTSYTKEDIQDMRDKYYNKEEE